MISSKEKSLAKRVSVWLWEEDYPHSLNQEELQTPALVLQHAFSRFSLADCQYLLWEWQHCHYRPFAFSFGDGLPTLFRFRKMLNKLLDVAWLMRHDVGHRHLLGACTMDVAAPLFDSHYFIALRKEHLDDIGGVLEQMLHEGQGAHGWKNVLYHWWGMGVSHAQLDDGTRTNPTDEIPEFISLVLMIEIQYVIAMSLKHKPVENQLSASAYLSLEEGEKPLKTLMKIFSKWEYEELKEKLRDAYCLVDYGFEEYSLGRQNGLVHTQHKIIALASLLAQKDDDYFSHPDTFTFGNEEVGNFWEPDHYIPFHHLTKAEYDDLLTTLRSFDFAELHRQLHRYVVFLIERNRVGLSDEVLLAAELFQQLERLFETLYLFTVQRIQIND